MIDEIQKLIETHLQEANDWIKKFEDEANKLRESDPVKSRRAAVFAAAYEIFTADLMVLRMEVKCLVREAQPR